MTDEPPLADVARRVYAAPPDAFVATRADEAAALKRAGDAAAAATVRRFRKPTAPADLVNRLVREESGLLDEVADLGQRLRAAQASSDAGALRALDAERRSLVARCVTAVRSSAGGTGGRAPSESSLREVEQTVWAALVDPVALAAVRTATLVRPLSPGGFGSVDVTGASAVEVAESQLATVVELRPRRRADGAAPRPATADDQRRRRRAQAEADLATARDALATAEHDFQAAGDAERAARERAADLHQEQQRIRARLEALDDELRTTTKDVTDRGRQVRRAEQARRARRADVDRARQRVDDQP